MSTLVNRKPPVKTVILFSANRPTNRVATFGLGVFPQRDRRLPIGPTISDRLWAASNLTDWSHSPSEEDEFNERIVRTMSASEYADHVEHCRSAFADLDATWHEDEPQFSDDYLAALALESAELDAACGQTFTPEAPMSDDEPTPLDAMSESQLVDEFIRLASLLPTRELGWTTEEALAEYPEIGQRMAAINAMLFAVA